MCNCTMIGTSLQGDRWWLELMVDSSTMSNPWSRADHSTLIKAQFSTLNVAAERGTSEKMEATCRRAHDQRRRLEAEDCDRCGWYAQFISGGRRCRCPPYCLAHACPTMRCIRLIICIMHVILTSRCHRGGYDIP